MNSTSLPILTNGVTVFSIFGRYSSVVVHVVIQGSYCPGLIRHESVAKVCCTYHDGMSLSHLLIELFGVLVITHVGRYLFFYYSFCLRLIGYEFTALFC
ncbi:hypothetical protein XfCFBP8082_03120 [Xylella fastidiosa subsp. fastidiosa]|jgi:hypothetical protein|uniref:Uncharacterized protein n=1 Tax=Xylella fastidiosa (strain Temecula1 / ATCC 700964) TaxID=183190 RepID=Q87FB1_XYLFT|nr:conserved hypothetical protein [Xylella fastidiosa Temecula1]EGO82735.1 hypothetical protein XFEB_00408 [Xylella fastidiosa EB92.1]NBI37750.1 hypothetical protein [Xylella fastidiosa subsp. fastidiosa]QIS24811.1 hypothetical protein F7G16_00095 [Xylella fastidiosa]RWA33548.1 hypothetical protein XfCFBP7969_03250 [Xylella fastidiosa subsp. fastidiosa]